MKKEFLEVGLFIIFVVIAAIILEVFLELYVCPLCVYQRVLYTLIGISLILFALHKEYLLPKLVFLTFMFTCGLTLSVFHFGVEQSWWEARNVCEIIDASKLSYEDFVKMLEGVDIRGCKHNVFKIGPFSLTFINIIINLSLLVWFFRRSIHVSKSKNSWSEK